MTSQAVWRFRIYELFAGVVFVSKKSFEDQVMLLIYDSRKSIQSTQSREIKVIDKY